MHEINELVKQYDYNDLNVNSGINPFKEVDNKESFQAMELVIKPSHCLNQWSTLAAFAKDRLNV